MINIKRYNLNDVLIWNKKKFNVNNLWKENRPDDYDYKLSQTNTGKWIDFFHDEVPRLYIDKIYLSWMKEASQIGFLTGKFSELYNDELEMTVEKYKDSFPSSERNYFIRTERVSLKYGCGGPGPYDNIESVIKSLVSSSSGHRCINNDDNNGCLYFIKWIENYDIDKEFRVFVFENKIRAISTQHIYKINHWLNSLTDDQISSLIEDMIYYFEINIRDKLTFLGNYVMDIYYTGDNWYFIEPNTYGAEYASGSALYHWHNDNDLLNGLSSDIELRYVNI